MAQPIIKTREEVEAMRPACALVAKALRLMESMAEPGVTTRALNEAVETLFEREGGRPLFKGYPNPTPGVAPFPASICASINEEVVHGIPDDRELKDGDEISVDVGVELNGFCGDAARTFAVGTPGRKTKRLLQTARDCLEEAVRQMRPGRTLADVSRAIQKRAEDDGYAVVRQFVGHGIGRKMHEPPQVPNYVSRANRELDLSLREGLILAIEPMVNVGGGEVRILSNGWTVITKDRTLSAHFEDTVAVTEDGPLVLTAT